MYWSARPNKAFGAYKVEAVMMTFNYQLPKRNPKQGLRYLHTAWGVLLLLKGMETSCWEWSYPKSLSSLELRLLTQPVKAHGPDSTDHSAFSQCLLSKLWAPGHSYSPLPFSRQVRVTFCWCSRVSTGWGEARRFGWFPYREWITWGLGREAIGSMALQVGEVKHELPFTREAR